MRRLGSIFILLAFLGLAPSSGLASGVLSCGLVHQTATRSLSGQSYLLRLKIGGTFLRAVEVKLMEQQRSDLAAMVRKFDLSKGIDTKDHLGSEYSEFNSVADLLRSHLLAKLADAESKQVLKYAIADAKQFLEISNDSLLSDIPLFNQGQGLIDFKDRNSAPAFMAEKDTQTALQAQWAGVNEYVESRLASLTVILDALRDGDQIVLSNLSAETLIGADASISKISRLNLPLVAWEKEIYLIEQKNGARILALTGFSSEAYRQHFNLMIRRQLSKNRRKIKISTVEDGKIYDQKASSLFQFIAGHRAAFEGQTALIFGYPRAFQEAWVKYHAKSLQDPGSPWRIELYALPHGQKAMVVSSDLATYGEALGKQVHRAAPLLPKLSHVFFGGSGGALNEVPEYSLQAPSYILSTGGKAVFNVLAKESEVSYHQSVRSPLEETPALLRSLGENQVISVDMEIGDLAAAVQPLGLHLGVGVLITDFPNQANPKINLDYQDFQKKDKARADYVDRVFEVLMQEGGQK